MDADEKLNEVRSNNKTADFIFPSNPEEMSTQHTYLRYECADAFGLVASSGSLRVPHSNSNLALIEGDRGCPLVLSGAGSHCAGFHLKTANQVIKIGHREDGDGGLGTGMALNSGQIVCLDVTNHANSGENRVATGWMDGAVRVFNLASSDLREIDGKGLVNSLLAISNGNSEVQREPLVLNGHSSSPVRSISFDKTNTFRLASGSSDGAVVLWDVVEESGLFRFMGHKCAVTDIVFSFLDHGTFDGLITSSLDGLVKIWDLKAQCCVQTIPSNRGKVSSLACMVENIIPRAGFARVNDDRMVLENWERARLVTCDDRGVAKVWNISSPSCKPARSRPDANDIDSLNRCQLMGTLGEAASDKAACNEGATIVRFHPNGKYLGVLYGSSRSIRIYAVRSPMETQKKRQRRLSRRRQKEIVPAETPKGKTQKRGIIDDIPEPRNSNMHEKWLDTGFDASDADATDEFEFLGTAKASQKVRCFLFVPWEAGRNAVRLACSLSTNAIEVLALSRSKPLKDECRSSLSSRKVGFINAFGHSTGIRAVELSSDDSLACTVSKNCFIIWNVVGRKCIQSVRPSHDTGSLNGVCATFLPGNSHLVLGTREGHLALLDIAAGDIIIAVENAHEESIWSLDLQSSTESGVVSLVTGSADKTVKFWTIEKDEDGFPRLVHSRTLETGDDVVAVRYSNSTVDAKRMVFVSTMDSTVKVFFADTLKFFLSLYGHKLPALAVDASDDDTLLATSGADKLIKIWGLDFGDTHRTLHGHEDSITDLRFVRKTHNFFTSSKDGSVRYWDGDRFEQILILRGHFGEVSSLAISRSGAFVLSAGMDRQVRVWERTKDIVFLQEERDMILERVFDHVDRSNHQATGEILRKNVQDDDTIEVLPQSEAAVMQSILSVAAADRLLAALELADDEIKSTNSSKQSEQKSLKPNPLLLGMDPSDYILWVLKSIKYAELEQSLLVLPAQFVCRMLYFLVSILRSGQAVETCSRVAIFLVRAHQKQIQANPWKFGRALQELRRLLRLNLGESRSVLGFNLSGLRLAQVHSAGSQRDSVDPSKKELWSGIALRR